MGTTNSKPIHYLNVSTNKPKIKQKKKTVPCFNLIHLKFKPRNKNDQNIFHLHVFMNVQQTTHYENFNAHTHTIWFSIKENTTKLTIITKTLLHCFYTATHH